MARLEASSCPPCQPAAPLVQPAEQREVNCLDLPSQRIALWQTESVPEGQQVFLAVRAEDCEKLFSVHYTPMFRTQPTPLVWSQR